MCVLTIHFNDRGKPFMATTQPLGFAQKWDQTVDAWHFFTQQQWAFDTI